MTMTTLNPDLTATALLPSCQVGSLIPLFYFQQGEPARWINPDESVRNADLQPQRTPAAHRTTQRSSGQKYVC